MKRGVKMIETDRLSRKLRDAKKKGVQSLTFQAVNLLGLLVRMLSRRQTRTLAVFLGDFLHRVIGIRRELVYRNLSLAFPEKSNEEIRDIATAVYRNVCTTLLEVLRLPLIRSREDAAALVDIEGDEFFDWYRNRKTGAVIVSAHYGNWELMAYACGLLVQPISIIVKRLRNAPIDQKMNEYRTLGGNSVIYHAQAPRQGLRLLQNGGFLSILGDQSDHKASHFGEFLGRRATMFQGPAFFALKARVPLFITICNSNGDGRYTVSIREIETSDLSFCKDDIATLAGRYTRAIEAEIVRHPEEWFWLHDRWKRG
jgi:KDO2-lipid IV(A) lauroyltransferase